MFYSAGFAKEADEEKCKLIYDQKVKDSDHLFDIRTEVRSAFMEHQHSEMELFQFLEHGESIYGVSNGKYHCVKVCIS